MNIEDAPEIELDFDADINSILIRYRSLCRAYETLLNRDSVLAVPKSQDNLPAGVKEYMMDNLIKEIRHIEKVCTEVFNDQAKS